MELTSAHGPRLSKAEARALAEFAEDPATPPREAWRARIVLEAGKGLTNQQAAERLGTSPSTVARWLARYTETGLAGLSGLPRPGRPRFAQRSHTAALAATPHDANEATIDPTLEQLLAAACRTISRRGVAATRVADIAREARVSPATVHYYFKTKEDILVKALLWANRTSANRLLPADGDVHDPATRLTNLIERSVPYEGTQRDEYLLEIDLWSSIRQHPEMMETWESYHLWWVAQVTKIIQDGLADGCFRTDLSAEEVAQRLVALTDGLSAQAAIGSSSMPPDRVRELVLRFASDHLGVALAPV
jgi:AcrR family transcriptional regulator